MFWCFWWACGPCGLLASLGRSWVLGVLLGRVVVLRKCIPNASMLQVCLATRRIEIGALACHALVGERSRSTIAGTEFTPKARQEGPGRPPIVLRAMIQITSLLSRYQRANHWVLLLLPLHQHPQAAVSEPLGSAPPPTSAPIQLNRLLLLQFMLLHKIVLELAPPI